MNVPDALGYYKPDAPYETVTWKVTLYSEQDFTPEECEFDTEEEADEAWKDNLDLVEMKRDELDEALKTLSERNIQKVVD